MSLLKTMLFLLVLSCPSVLRASEQYPGKVLIYKGVKLQAILTP